MYSKLLGFFVDDRIMSSQLQHPGSLHAADASADDGDSLRLCCLLDIMLAMLHCLGIDCAAGKMEAI